jgi:hypothetical protein
MDDYPDSSCRCFDGRILSGIAWYCQAHYAEHRSFPAELEAVLSSALAMVQELIGRQGWYDAGCLCEGDCHIWYGNMNLISGLLAVWQILQQMSQSKLPTEQTRAAELASPIENGVKAAFRFLTQTNGAITGQPAFLPTQIAQWAAGTMYEICREYVRSFGPDAGVDLLQEHINLRAGTYVAQSFYRNNASAAALLGCPEFEKIAHKTIFPWDVLKDGASGQ